MPQIVAGFRQLRPGFHIKKADLAFQARVLFVKTVRSDTEGAKGGSLCGGSEQGVPNHIAFNNDGIEVIHNHLQNALSGDNQNRRAWSINCPMI
jgi:hypothetical protein